jgi:AAA domain
MIPMPDAAPSTRWVVPDVLPEGISVLSGPGFAGKTSLALGLAMDLAAGKPILGRIEAGRGEAVFLCAAHSPDLVTERLRGMDRPPETTPGFHLLFETYLPVPFAFEAALGRLNRCKNPKLVVIDGWLQARSTDARVTTAFLGRLKRLCADRRMAALVVATAHGVRAPEPWAAQGNDAPRPSEVLSPMETRPSVGRVKELRPTTIFSDFAELEVAPTRLSLWRLPDGLDGRLLVEHSIEDQDGVDMELAFDDRNLSWSLARSVTVPAPKSVPVMEALRMAEERDRARSFVGQGRSEERSARRSGKE